ncbi:hypothetical protein [Deinococcus sp. QL22]|uniref:hypothetical protein n=1 Tax=Deinococcus sp. QL22 TaxID=2939437 RepID=UPI002017D3F3|nr:hypothetical protein [Deinococcus sp. QL22]UQN07495.1 hypothetical protein M1R55_06290 [Deinococcus sp. QL22]
MTAYLWNLSALLAFLITGLWGFLLVSAHAFLLLPLTLILLAALNWGFYRSRFRRWRTVMTWAYIGFSLGILVGVGGGVKPFWVSATTIVASAFVFLVLPYRFNQLVWTLALLRARPPGWSGPQAQNRAEVLASGPFTLHEVFRVTEHVEGGMVQKAERELDRLECRYQGEPVATDKLLSELENWVLARYRAYRTLRRLPISAEVRPPRDVVREEAQPIELYGSAAWAGSKPLADFEVFLHSPYQLWVKCLQVDLEYRLQYAGQQERIFVCGSEYGYSDRGDDHYSEVTQAEAEREGLILEAVTLKLRSTGQTVGKHADLASAESEVLRRYRSQRPPEQELTQV